MSDAEFLKVLEQAEADNKRFISQIERDGAVLAERERCARIADSMAFTTDPPNKLRKLADDIAAAIRSGK